MLPDFHVLMGAVIWHPTKKTMMIDSGNKLLANMANLTEFILVPTA
jgi:hypothetical protein